MLKGIYIVSKEYWSSIYNAKAQDMISRYVDIYANPMDADDIATNPEILKEADVIFCGWGMVRMSEEVLSHAPNLKIIFYGAGSIRSFATDAMWRRGIKVCSAYAANAIPVAEMAFAEIIISLKRGWEYILANEKRERLTVAGCYKSIVGIVSLGMIGRIVCEKLKTLDVNVIAYDPFVTKETAEQLGVTTCSLEEVFSNSDVVSLHAPWLKETEKMINGALFASMKQNSAFINTARGAVVNEAEMIAVLKKRKDIYAILDVTYPETPVDGSPLYKMDNVILTPHIAGSMDGEIARMGSYMVSELEKYVRGESLECEITQERASTLA